METQTIRPRACTIIIYTMSDHELSESRDESLAASQDVSAARRRRHGSTRRSRRLEGRASRSAEQEESGRETEAAGRQNERGGGENPTRSGSAASRSTSARLFNMYHCVYKHLQCTCIYMYSLLRVIQCHRLILQCVVIYMYMCCMSTIIICLYYVVAIFCCCIDCGCNGRYRRSMKQRQDRRRQPVPEEGEREDERQSHPLEREEGGVAGEGEGGGVVREGEEGCVAREESMDDTTARITSLLQRIEGESEERVRHGQYNILQADLCIHVQCTFTYIIHAFYTPALGKYHKQTPRTCTSLLVHCILYNVYNSCIHVHVHVYLVHVHVHVCITKYYRT